MQMIKNILLDNFKRYSYMFVLWNLLRDCIGLRNWIFPYQVHSSHMIFLQLRRNDDLHVSYSRFSNDLEIET